MHAPSHLARKLKAMIDWSECPLVQRDPDYVSGQPALRADPRMTVDALVECADDGMTPEEISETYNVPVATIRTLLDYAAKHRVLAAAAV
jgi:uncharacterized protein (DUF433 family)